MKLSERQKKNKEKTQQQLRQIVSEYSSSARRAAPAPAHPAAYRSAQAQTNAPSRPASQSMPKKKKKKRVTLGRLLGLGSKKKTAAKTSPQQASRPVRTPFAPAPRKSSATAQLRDTISDYRSKPMSKAKKRRRNVLYYLLFAAVIIAVFLISSLTVLFNISKITVSGNSRYTAEEIISASGIEKDKNMFRLNLGKIEAAMEGSMPYLKSVDIRRVLPDGISIDVVETAAVAAVSCDGYMLIDADSKALERVDALPSGVMEVTGAELTFCECGRTVTYASEDTAGIISAVCTVLDTAQLRDKVTSLDVGKRYDVKFVYNGLITCLVGNTDNLETKLSLIKIALADNPADVKAVIDATDSQRSYYRPEFE